MKALSLVIPRYLFPGDIRVGVIYGDIREIGQHVYVMCLPHADMPLAQLTHVGSREDRVGNVVTLRSNDMGPNGNSGF